MTELSHGAEAYGPSLRPCITVENVSYAYPNSGGISASQRRWALKGISLEIAQGELLAVMGANGAGKTSFLKLCNGLIPHSEGGTLRGTVTVDGIDTGTSSVAELAGRVGMAMDDPDTQVFTALVRDEVAFGPENLLVPPAEIARRVAWALEMTGLSGRTDSAVTALSGGEKQRLAIAAALAMANRALVLDEPSSRLDPEGAEALMSLLLRLRKQHRLTVILATHNSGEAARADRICVLNNGSIAACDTPRAIFGNRELVRDNWIRPPDVSELAHYLDERGAPLPVFPVLPEELVRYYEA
jgi:energy-coupling factor transporter ATP-binding protein EcfA2